MQLARISVNRTVRVTEYLGRSESLCMIMVTIPFVFLSNSVFYLVNICIRRLDFANTGLCVHRHEDHAGGGGTRCLSSVKQ